MITQAALSKSLNMFEPDTITILFGERGSMLINGVILTLREAENLIIQLQASVKEAQHG